MLSDIKIYRDFNITAGYVRIPPNREIDRSRVTVARALNTLPDTTVVELSAGSGPNTGSKFGAQRWLRLPPLSPGETYLARYGYDPQEVLAWWHDAGVVPTTNSA